MKSFWEDSTVVILDKATDYNLISENTKLRDALEFYADSLYKEGLAYVKKEDRGIPINPCDPGTLYTPYKLSYDKGEIAKQALQQED